MVIALLQKEYNSDNAEDIKTFAETIADIKSTNIFMSDIYSDYYGKWLDEELLLFYKKIRVINPPDYHTVHIQFGSDRVRIKIGFRTSFTVLYLSFIVLLLIALSSTPGFSFVAGVSITAMYSLAYLLRIPIIRWKGKKFLAALDGKLRSSASL